MNILPDIYLWRTVCACKGKLAFLHGFCLVAQMSMRTRTTFPLTE